VPNSARLVVLGAHASNTGCLRVYELEGHRLALRGEAKGPSPFKSGTFAASSLADRHLATGDCDGARSGPA